MSDIIYVNTKYCEKINSSSWKVNIDLNILNKNYN